MFLLGSHQSSNGTFGPCGFTKQPVHWAVLTAMGLKSENRRPFPTLECHIIPKVFFLKTRRDAQYSNSDITVLENIFIFKVCVKTCMASLLTWCLSWVGITMSTGSGNTTWPGIPLTPSPVAWHLRSVHFPLFSTKTTFFRLKGTLASLSTISGLEYIGPKEPIQYFIKDTNMV